MNACSAVGAPIATLADNRNHPLQDAMNSSYLDASV